MTIRLSNCCSIFVGLAIATLFLGCNSKPGRKTLFKEVSPVQTGIAFENKVIQNGENNVLNYTYYFNGGGIAVGDINNDGLPDIYWSGNQVSNKLYLNKGQLKFEDITDRANVGVREGWKTGVTMADVNQDGWLDIYVCRSAMSDSALRENLLFVNNKDLTFTERAREFGVNDNSYSSHAAFFDYDRDQDLDLFVLNHSLPKYASLTNVVANRNQKGAKFGSKLYENRGGHFVDVSAKAGIINNVLSFGLGVAISDLNGDGWPDLYVSNDFNEEDYLYLNNQNGTFTNAVKKATGHVSLFSMGSDVADINNDGLPDFVTLDMLPASNERIKLSSGDDNYDKYQILINAGFHHQTMRNMLQLNNGDGTFSEIGQLAGISNTDWSWAPLLVDFDGDGWKDLFISNGYEKDFTNMQFLKFTVDERLKARQTGVAPDVRTILEKMPSIEEGNYLFKNNGDLTFTDRTSDWGISRRFKSNGAAYSDLDNDGDPDLLINTMNQPAVIYQNTTAEEGKTKFLKVDFQKKNPNRIVTGAKLKAYAGGRLQYQEFSPNRGFQSCMTGPLIVGMDSISVADSIRVIWPDNKTQLFLNWPTRDELSPVYEEATKSVATDNKHKPFFSVLPSPDWKHTPAEKNDFKRQFLIPRMYSVSGPKIAAGDSNGDGLIDLYVCGPEHQGGSILVQQPGGNFTKLRSVAIEADKNSQDEDAVFFDADGDGDQDLYVVSGGYGMEPGDPRLQDRLYINDGHGNFENRPWLPKELLAGSCVKAIDVDSDKDMDLFVGTRLQPGQYPLSSTSMLLINDGKGHFSNATASVAPELEKAGMVCDAVVADLNRDGMPDLIVVGEWTPVRVMINRGGKLHDETTSWLSLSTQGWWNCIVSKDFDHDGDDDIMIGNYGENSQFKASVDRPLTLQYKDYNNDGQVDPFFCYFIQGTPYPYASRDEALGQVSFLKARFRDYTSYARATMDTLFTKEERTDEVTLQADLLKTVYLENKGSKFEIKELPIQAQFSPVYAIAVWDIDSDGDEDVVLGGNETLVRARIGKLDANKGFVLLNDGHGTFTYLPQAQSGLNLTGDVRQLLFISSKKGSKLVVGEISQPITIYSLSPTDRSLNP